MELAPTAVDALPLAPAASLRAWRLLMRMSQTSRPPSAATVANRLQDPSAAGTDTPLALLGATSARGEASGASPPPASAACSRPSRLTAAPGSQCRSVTGAWWLASGEDRKSGSSAATRASPSAAAAASWPAAKESVRSLAAPSPVPAGPACRPWPGAAAAGTCCRLKSATCPVTSPAASQCGWVGWKASASTSAGACSTASGCIASVWLHTSTQPSGGCCCICAVAPPPAPAVAADGWSGL